MSENEIIDAYLNRIKVQLVNLKFTASPSKLKGKLAKVPMSFLAGVDGETQERLKTRFKILSRGFCVDDELAAAGMDARFGGYLSQEEAVKTECIYQVEGIGSVILTEDIEKCRDRVAGLQKDAESLQMSLVLLLKEKVQVFAAELYDALAALWGSSEPAWWVDYKLKYPMDTRARRSVFCDLMYLEIEKALALKPPKFWILFTRFNSETMAIPEVRKAFKSAFCQYLRRGSGRDLDWLIGPDPNDKQGRLFDF